MLSQKNSALSTADFTYFFRRSLALTAALAGPLLSTAALAQSPQTIAQAPQTVTSSPRTTAQALAPAAQQTVTQAITFSASHENYWGGAFANAHRLELFGGYPNGTITFLAPFSTDFTIPANHDSSQKVTFSGGLSGSAFGLTLNAYATAGDVTVNYPGNLALTFDPKLSPNSLFNFQTSFARDQTNSNLDITPPGFDATLGAIAQGNLSLTATVHTPGSLPNFDVHILNTNLPGAFTLFDVQNDLIAPLETYGGLNQQHDLHDIFDKVPAGVLSFEVDDPRVVNFTNNSTASSTQLSYNGYQQLLNLNGDISNLMGYLGYAYFTDGQSLPHGLFNADYDYNVGVSIGGINFGGDLNFAYQIADLYGNMPLGFDQAFTFDTTPKTTITLVGPGGKQIGQPQTLLVGKAGSINIPETYSDGTPILPYGSTSVPITVQATLDFSQNDLHNNTSLQWSPGLYFEPYNFSATATIDYGFGSFSKSGSVGYPVLPLATHTFSYTALSSDTTIKDYTVSPSTVTTTINYEGTSIDNPHPTLTSLSQKDAVTGSPGFRLTLTGTGFTPETKLLLSTSGVSGVSSQARSSHYLSPTSLQTDLQNSDLRDPASLSLSVFNPGLPRPATYVSNALPFLVAVPGCYLDAGAVLKLDAQGQDALDLTMSNNSTVDAKDVSISSITLNHVSMGKAGQTQKLGTITSGTMKQAGHYLFPSSLIPASASTMQLKVTGTYNGLPFSTTVRLAVPPVQLIADAGARLSGLAPTLSLTLRNLTPVDATNVQLFSVAVNGVNSITPLGSLGTIQAGGKSSTAAYDFPANINLIFASSVEVTVSGTANGKPFTLIQNVPLAH